MYAIRSYYVGGQGHVLADDLGHVGGGAARIAQGLGDLEIDVGKGGQLHFPADHLFGVDGLSLGRGGEKVHVVVVGRCP